MTRRTRLTLMAAAALTLWFVLVLTLWALPALTDSIPVGANAKGQPTSQEVECNSLFDSSPRSKPLPVVTKPMTYERESCVAVHREARIVFGIDAAVFLVGMFGLGAIVLSGRRAEPAVPVGG